MRWWGRPRSNACFSTAFGKLWRRKLMRYTSHCKLQNNCVCLPKTRSNLGWQLGHQQEEKLGLLSLDRLASLLFLLHCNEHPEDCAARLIQGEAQALAGRHLDVQAQTNRWLCMYITWQNHSLASDSSFFVCHVWQETTQPLFQNARLSDRSLL